MNIIQSINNFLSDNGISQRHIAKEAGMTDVSISKLLSFNRMMYYHKFLDVLGSIHFKIVNENEEEVPLSSEEIIPHIMHYMRKNDLQQKTLAGKIEITTPAMCQFFGFKRHMAYNKFIQVLLITGFKILDRDGNIVIGNDVKQDIEDHFYSVGQ